MTAEESAIDTLRTILSGAVHDLNNALAPILLYADLLGETVQDEPSRKKTAAILDQAGKIRLALESIRILYKAPSEEACGPAQLAPHYHRLLRPLFQKCGTRISWWVEAGLPPCGPEVGERQMEFFTAALALTRGASSPLGIVWKSRRGAGSEIRVFSAADLHCPTIDPQEKAVEAVVILDRNGMAALLSGPEPQPILTFSWN